ncbi:MAG TPA: pilus assembly protein TadG-related protein [Longimicrobiales bacterium]|nr:pilus assembly protein TadG-related protein [Longimicrobiales bacterium]
MTRHNRTAVETRRRTLRRSLGIWVSDERGSVSATVAISMTALLAILALGIDLGALLNARAEAQRAADAAALAGASAFLEYQQDQARQEAVRRAVEFATSNEVRNEIIRPEDVSVWVDTDSSTVRAAIRREGLDTWFARIFGINEVNVAAEATAWAGAAGAAQCVKPFAVPDLWEETTDDANGNRLWDEGERWKYQPENGDRYERYSGPGSTRDETGYGSGWRDGEVDATGRRYDRDYGRLITIKVTDPQQTYVPSFFLPWVLPSDPDQPACGSRPGGGGGGGNGGGNGGGGSGGGGGEGGGDNPPDEGGGGAGWLKWREKRGDLGVSEPPGLPGEQPGNGGGSGGGGVGQDDGSGRGAARYRQNICSCNSSIIDLDTEYLIEPGNMVGPTYQGVQQLIAQDPDARWDPRTNTVVSQYGMESPRVVTVALFDPAEITKPGRQYLRFNNFARVFIEEQASRQDPVTGRFLYYVPGVGRGRSGETKGSLVRVLQLIR